MSAPAAMIPAGPLLPPNRGILLYWLAIFCFGFVAAAAVAGLSPDRPARRLTVQIVPDGNASYTDEIPAALAVLKATPGIASTSVLSDSDNLELVAPWLGGEVTPASLPFPVLIDVKLAPGNFPDVPALQKRLVSSAPHAVLDDSRRRAAGMTAVPKPGDWLAALLLGAACLAFGVSFLLLSRARIAANRETLQLLHLLGATRSRIARLFTLPLAIGVFLACAAGTGLAGGVFLLPAPAFGQGLAMLGSPGGEWLWLAIIPVIAAIMAWLTGWFLVTSELRRF